jgi:orotate phosphoribosyltransferase
MMEFIDDLRRADSLDPDDSGGFIRRGHFVYESGDHGDTWLALDLLFADPHRLRHAAGQLAAQLRPHAPEVVCGPLVGGALVAQWVAHDLNAAFVYTTPQTGYAIPQDLTPFLPGKRTVIVDDAINAGWAARACVREIERHRGRVVAVAALLVQSPAPEDLPAPVTSLVELHRNIWPATDCPLCRAAVPMDRTDKLHLGK